ncbi:MAG TPA: hybrid sensor histidine kinase/response regulator, partial [Proteobacteria bacterium]|nr:hybrid sensor histidine kinase/response regulator [Pseudomonadota bacterium]
EAITAAPETTDLVLTDQVMPALSGTALAERLAKVRADLPVILLTGYSDEEGARCPALRARLAKPISAPDLALTLDRLLHP